MEDLENWTYNDFLTYLLILGANPDLNITSDEENEIAYKMGEEEYKKVKMVFDRQNDVEHIDVVSFLYAKYESQFGGKENLVKELKGIFSIGNKKENVLDRYMLMMLKKIL